VVERDCFVQIALYICDCLHSHCECLHLIFVFVDRIFNFSLDMFGGGWGITAICKCLGDV